MRGPSVGMRHRMGMRGPSVGMRHRMGMRGPSVGMRHRMGMRGPSVSMRWELLITQSMDLIPYLFSQTPLRQVFSLSGANRRSSTKIWEVKCCAAITITIGVT